MPSTKTDTSIWAASSQSAGATTTASAVNLTDGYGAEIVGSITNGGTGPTTPAYVALEESSDNSQWIEVERITAGVANSAVQPFKFVLGPACRYARLVSSGNTGQAVTLNARIAELTEVA